VKSIDIKNIDLQGTSLIEASAGTGKTYTITSLYLLLLMEKNFSVKEILVVTYTVAATSELRSRIRKRLIHCLKVLKSEEDHDSNDEAESRIFEKFNGIEEKIYHLESSIRNFDEAAIYTIHGFCQQALYEQAFNSNVLFNADLKGDETEEVESLVKDFWRGNFYETTPIIAQYFIEKKYPESLYSMVKKYRQNPTVLFNLHEHFVSQQSIEILHGEIKEAGELIKKILLSDKEYLLKFFRDKDKIKLTSYRESTLKNIFEELSTLENIPDAKLLKKIRIFKPDFIDEQLKTDEFPQSDFPQIIESFIDKTDEFNQIMITYESIIKEKVLIFISENLDSLKKIKGIRSFNDLISYLHNALKNSSNNSLHYALQKRYNAALIDEFQDTDPYQFYIFSSLFSSHGILYLIGDPKQAIYSFRGADLHAYLKASSSVNNQFTLNVNWRSAANLIKGHHELYRDIPLPFLLEGINYTEVSASEENQDNSFNGLVNKSPIQFWLLDSKMESSKGLISGEEARNVITANMIKEISILLDDKSQCFIDEKKVSPQDVAVLVRSNREAELVKRSLKNYGIPAIIYGEESVFSSMATGDFFFCLRAIVYPTYERYLNTALSSLLIGYDAEKLIEIINSSGIISEDFQNFKKYHDLLISDGIYKSVSLMFDDYHIQERLLSLPGGEAHYSNVIHCLELLNRESIESGFGGEYLLNWFHEKISRNEKGDDYRVRLDTDEEAVQIVTIHKSKGLEYPIVFCPFLWNSVKTKDEAIYHSNDDLIMQLDPLTDQEKAIVYHEHMAESLRIFYVAITRAKNRLYLAWGRINGAESSPMAYMFHNSIFKYNDKIISTPSQLPQSDEISKEIENRFKDSENIEITYIDSSVDIPQNKIDLKKKVKAPQQIKVNLYADYKIASYSSMAHSAVHHNDEELFNEDYEIPIKEDIVEDNIFSFPAGAYAGSTLHEILERVDYSHKEGREDIIENYLQHYSIDVKWIDVIQEMIDHTVNVFFNEAEVSLKDIPRSNMLHEMEFNMAIHNIRPADISHILKKSSDYDKEVISLMEHLSVNEIRGYLKGFIDLIFRVEDKYYILDWKSNHLGNDLEDYTTINCNKAMVSHNYYLQYHIYGVALHRYLETNLENYSYEENFGGAYYLFLRGLRKNQSTGVFFHRPEKTVIESFSAYCYKGIL